MKKLAQTRLKQAGQKVCQRSIPCQQASGRQECHSHGYAVVYHATPTRRSAPDHALVLPSLVGAKHTFAYYWCCV